MSKKSTERKRYDDGLKREAVQMLLDGYSAPSIASNLGIRNANLIHKWKKKILSESPVTKSLDAEVRELRSVASPNLFIRTTILSIMLWWSRHIGMRLASLHMVKTDAPQHFHTTQQQPYRIFGLWHGGRLASREVCCCLLPPDS